MRKGLSIILLASAVAVLTAAPAYAASSTPSAQGSGALVNDPALTAAAQAYWEEITATKEEVYGINSDGYMTLGTYGYRTHTASCFKQERDYWCGPASVRQSLSWHKLYSGSSVPLPSQATLSALIGTEQSHASSTVKMVDALWAYSGTYGPTDYAASDLTNCTYPVDTFYGRIGTMMSSNPGTIPIILAETEYIGRYNNHESRHYICISGIDDRSSTVKMRSVDCNWSSAYRGIFWDNMGDKTANGLFRSCWYADRNGSNKAMAW